MLGKELTGASDVTLDHSGLGFDSCGEVGYLIEQTASFSHQLTDLSVRVHHCRVISTTEGLANFWEGQISELPAQVHRYLAGSHQHS
jgi:hypothetical protein